MHFVNFIVEIIYGFSLFLQYRSLCSYDATFPECFTWMLHPISYIFILFMSYCLFPSTHFLDDSPAVVLINFTLCILETIKHTLMINCNLFINHGSQRPNLITSSYYRKPNYITLMQSNCWVIPFFKQVPQRHLQSSLRDPLF